MDTEVKQQFDYTLLLTNVQYMCSLFGMARLKDILRGLSEQAAEQYQELVKANDELSKLRDAARRFRTLEESVKREEESMRIGLALLISVPQKVKLDSDAYASTYRGELEEMREQAGLFVAADDLDLSRFPLWKVMREILRQTSEIRVYELESHLKSFGVKAARSAIESALLTHGKDFKVSKRGREKFVSLK
jgi:hypothetical protein